MFAPIDMSELFAPEELKATRIGILLMTGMDIERVSKIVGVSLKEGRDFENALHNFCVGIDEDFYRLVRTEGQRFPDFRNDAKMIALGRLFILHTDEGEIARALHMDINDVYRYRSIFKGLIRILDDTEDKVFVETEQLEVD